MKQQLPKHSNLPSLLSQPCWGPMQRSRRPFLNSLGALKCPWLKSLSPGLLSGALRWPLTHISKTEKQSQHWIQKALMSTAALCWTCCRVSAALLPAPRPYTQPSHGSCLPLHPNPLPVCPVCCMCMMHTPNVEVRVLWRSAPLNKWISPPALMNTHTAIFLLPVSDSFFYHG